ncbi:MAG: hypothetical protein U9R69_10945 [Thermodesulfobacteriota bacterium]|nr:hypothetical protein [Thermodesulfobacteriota bacterium]
MKQFRVTLIAVCLLVGWLGYSDISVLLRNPEPLEISIFDLETTGAPREWLTINNGYQDLLQGINMSGTMEVGSFLVPLKSSIDSDYIRVWFETRDPQIIDVLKTYYFILDTEEQRQTFLLENQQLFSARRQLTGMTAGNLVSDSNQKKLTQLLQQMNIAVADNTIFISEEKQPVVWRGIFFAGIAIIGLIKVGLSFREAQ